MSQLQDPDEPLVKRSAGLRKKAKLLIERRDRNSGLDFYFKKYWKRQLFFVALYMLFATFVWHMEYRYVAVAFGTAGVAMQLRDIKWMIAMAKEWPDIELFLDWDKIDSIAALQD